MGAGQDIPGLPAPPEGVALFLATRFADGISVGSLRVACAAIRHAHELQGHTVNPCADQTVKLALAGFACQQSEAGRQQRQAAALTGEAVAAIRRALNGRVRECVGAARDMALVSVTAATGLRRSEGTALAWGDIEIEGDGSRRVTVRRSKTDQAGAGAVVALPPSAVADLDQLAALRGCRDPGESVFGCCGRTVSNRIKALARMAGFAGNFSGHSPRVGMAVSMTWRGAPAAVTMLQGRWASAAMLAQYTRGLAAGEALAFLED